MSTKRRKAWLGAVIGAAASLLGGGISSGIGANSAKKQQRAAQIAQNKQDTYEMAQNLTAGYGDQSYIDDLVRHATFKLGGRKRKKCEDGGKFDYSSLINGVSSAANSIGTALTNANIANHSRVNRQDFFANVPKTEVVIPEYATNVEYMDRQLPMLKCGGKRRR